MKKLIASVLMLLLFGGLGLSQEKGNSDNTSSINGKSFALGVQGGFTTGVGFALKKAFSPKFAISAALCPPFYVDHRIVFSSAGVTGYLNLSNDQENYSFFTYLSAGVFYREIEKCINDNINGGCTPKNISVTNLNTGVGLGLQTFFNSLSLQLMLGYAAYNKTKGITKFLPTIEGGLYYYLK
jgi:hypothetical protein